MRLFISYSRQNEKNARQLFSNLQDMGVTVWFDREALLPGQDWQSAIKEAISESDTVLLLLSSQSVDRRGYFQKEMRLALEVLQTIPHGHIYLLPVRIDECRIPDPLAAIHCVDLFPDYEAGLRKIISALKFQRDLQAKVRAGDFDASGSKGHSASVLLINDEPSTMNALTDHLKSFGLSVSHAFNVPQAIKFIHDNNPDVIISDLSHFSFGTQVTDRAAFEILEWGMRNHNALKVIVTAAEITNERREEAKRLGAIGICNDGANLYRHLSAATGVEIPNPFPPDPEDINHDIGTNHEDTRNHISTAQQGMRPCSVFLGNMWHNESDAAFTRRLADDLQSSGIVVSFYEHTINFGAMWRHPADDLIENSDVVVFLISGAAAKASWLSDFVYKALKKKDDMVIPAILDDEGALNIPLMLRHVVPLDFRGNYKKAVEELVSFVRSTKCR